MKKLTAILIVLLCVFSIFAEWGRIQYLDEFGDVDPTHSDPYQIVGGTREVNGSTNYYYDYRLIASLPTEFGYSASIELNMFDDFGDYVVFGDGGEAVIRVKLVSGEIKEFTFDFDQYENILFLFNEYEIESMKQNIYLSGNDAVDLLNELYKGNDLKFVIYYGSIKYSFTIDAEGFKSVADGFIDNFMAPTKPESYDDGIMAGVSSYTFKTVNSTDYALGLHSSGFPEMDEYPGLSASLDFKASEDAFWYDNEGEYTFKAVNLVSADGKDVLQLSNEIETDEYGSYFSLYDSPRIPEIIAFAKAHGSVELKIEFDPAVEFDIPLTAEEIQELLSFPE